MCDQDIAPARGRARPSTALCPRLKIIRRKPRKRFRGTPPPPDFDIDKLAPGQLLTERETAAVVGRSHATLEAWPSYEPGRPLRWRRVGGRILYEVKAIRAFLKGNNAK